MTLWLYAILPSPPCARAAKPGARAAEPAGRDGAAEPAGQEVGGGSGAADPGTTAPADLGTGLAGEPVELLPCGELWVAAGRVDSPPAAAEPALRAHDAVVRRLQEISAALLPIRFGQTVPDAAALAELLAPRRPALARALQEVAGCRQMTLRVLAPAGGATEAAHSKVAAATPAASGESPRSPFGVSAPPDVSAETSTAASAESRAPFRASVPADVSAETPIAGSEAVRPSFDGPGTSPSFDVPAPASVSAETSTAAAADLGRAASGGSAEASAAGARGARYLAERREAARWRHSLPEIAPLLAELAPLVRAERIERGGPPPLVGSAYHLVPAERAGEWVARLESAAMGLAATGLANAGLAAPVPAAPAESGPAATGPAATDPAATDPATTDPATSLPRLAWSGPFPPWAFAPELV